MSFETVLTVLTGIVFCITLLELLWLLKIRMNAGWLLAIGIFSDFSAFLLEQLAHGCGSLMLTLFFAAGLLVMIFMHLPYCLNALLDRQFFLYLLFMTYLSISLLWSGNLIYGARELLYLLLHAVVPAIYILIVYAMNKKFSWNQTLTLGLLYCAALLFWGRTQAIYTGGDAFGGRYHAGDIGMVLITGVLAVWLPGIPVFGKIIAFIIGVAAALTAETPGPAVAFSGAVALVWAVALQAKKFKLTTVFTVVLVSCIVAGMVLIPVIRYSTSHENTNSWTNTFHYQEMSEVDRSFPGSLFLDKQVLNILKEHPLTGSGLGGLYRRTRDEAPRASAPHNILLKMLAEWGVIGFSIWSFFILVTARKLKNAPVPLCIFLFSLFCSLESGDIGSNNEYVLIGLVTPLFSATRDESVSPSHFQKSSGVETRA